MFTQADGCALAPGWGTWRFGQLVQQLGLPRIRLHDLRHTSATLGLASGESIKEISARLGHATLAITADLYTDIDENLARRSARRLAHLVVEQDHPDRGRQDVADGRTGGAA